LPGKPDAVIPDLRLAVLVHGCFWHQHGICPDSRLPGSNRTYWLPKLAANKLRDRRIAQHLRRLGWHVFVIWDCQVTVQGLSRLADRITRLPHVSQTNARTRTSPPHKQRRSR
jgi:DNA mismatch endonuclease (patch repair protein)